MATSNPNKVLAEAIAQFNQQLSQIDNKAELLQLLDKLALLPQPIRYHYKQRWQLCNAGLLISLLVAVLTYQLHADTLLYYIAAVMALISLIPLLIALHHIHQLNLFTKQLYWKNALLDNQLTLLKKTDWPATSHWLQQFAEFKRGNYKREFKQLIQGQFTGSEHSFSYHYWHFHYVNRRTEVSTNNKGQVTTRVVYDHFDRYGIMLPFAYCRNLFITAFAAEGIRGDRYTSDSGRFNKLFQVRAADTMQAARFLKPAVIIALEEQAAVLKQLNLAFSDNGELCISFADKNVLDSQPAYGLDQLALFRQSIEQPTALPKLQQLLNTVHQLLRHSDSNF
ncbi:DUF3137 domain-containing protein [Alishewanella sp. d11]|uniref:DUF3137 domain-containing protein n=1 Tax=Alishewanella sp. d11 TaxID=3414030 RepID=UPI003BF7D5F8